MSEDLQLQEQLAALLRGQNAPSRSALIDAEIQRALGFGKPSGHQFTTPWGAGLGGLADAVRGTVSAYRVGKLEDEKRVLADSMEGPDRASALASVLRGEDPAAAGAMLQLDPSLRPMGAAMVDSANQKQSASLRELLAARQRQAQQEAEALRRRQALADGAMDRKFRAEQNALNRASQERAAALSAGTKSDDKLERDVQHLSKSMEGVAPTKSDLEALSTEVAKEDIPGLGKGYRLVPDFMEGMFAGEDGMGVRQRARGVVGAYLKERSGAAASDAEVDRVTMELGMGPDASEQRFKLGFNRLLGLMQDVAKNKQAGVRPEALAEAKRRGVVTSDDLPKPGAQPVTEAPPALVLDGQRYVLQADGTYLPE